MPPKTIAGSVSDSARTLKVRIVVSGFALLIIVLLGATMLLAGPARRPPPPVVTAPVRSPSPTPDLNPIIAENAKPGTDGWRIERGSGASLEGYAGATSVSPGQTLQLFV